MAKKGFAWLLLKGRQLVQLLTNDKIKANILVAVPFWAASLITGLVAVGYAWLFSYMEHLSAYIFKWKDWSIFLMAPLCMLVAWWLVQRWAPNARGSGIPQVMAAIELATPRHNAKVDLLLSFRIIVVKIASSLMMVLGGAAIGREGPTIQIAGAVFRIIFDSGCRARRGWAADRSAVRTAPWRRGGSRRLCRS
ncbi:MAG: chloride channel protein, partial [Chitinophagaceae bacterium]